MPAFPGYEVLQLLGRGGMGAVYLARHQRLDRLVALKVILGAAQADPERLARFLREGQALARLEHPHILRLHDLAEHDGVPYMALEYATGGSLADRLRDGPLPPAEAAHLVEVLASAVHHAHRHGLVHRDLKPGNVLLTADGAFRVADFGLVRLLEDSDRLTHSGAVLGTPAYMAPEQARGEGSAIGPAADVWALGVLLYECLTGRVPFRGGSTLDTLRLVAEAKPAPPRHLRPETPPELEAVCLRCLEKQPQRRPASAAALADALRAFRQAAPAPAAVPRRRLGLWWAAAALGTVMLLLALAWPLLRPAPRPGGGADPVVAAERPAADDGGAPPRQPPVRPRKGPGRSARFHERAWWKEDVPGAMFALALSPDGKVIAVARGLGPIVLRDTATGARLGEKLTLGTFLRCLAFAPDGGMLAAGGLRSGLPAGVAVWELPARRQRRLPELVGAVSHLAFAPRGDRLAAIHSALDFVEQPRIVGLWEPGGERLVARLEHKGDVRAVSFSPDGGLLATGCQDRTVALWDAATGTLQHTFRQEGEVECLAFSPDGRLLAVGQGAPPVGGAGGAVSVWDLRS
jgi:hypothetical protein